MPFPTKAALVSLALVPVVLPAVYLAVVQALVSRQTAAAGTARRVLSPRDKTLKATSAAPVDKAAPPKSLPEHLFAPDAPYVVTCERIVSKPVAAAALTDPVLRDADASIKQQTSFLLTSFLRGTMSAFSETPQGRFLQRRLVADAVAAAAAADTDTDASASADAAAAIVRRSFTPSGLDGLAFVAGNIACGAYRVTYRAGAEGDAALSRDRVELSIVPMPPPPPPQQQKQRLVVHGIVVVEIERTPTDVVFVNETWMWRHAANDKPVVLESRVGRWLHRLTVGWVIRKGCARLTAPVKVKAE